MGARHQPERVKPLKQAKPQQRPRFRHLCLRESALLGFHTHSFLLFAGGGEGTLHCPAYLQDLSAPHPLWPNMPQAHRPQHCNRHHPIKHISCRPWSLPGGPPIPSHNPEYSSPPSAHLQQVAAPSEPNPTLPHPQAPESTDLAFCITC